MATDIVPTSYDSTSELAIFGRVLSNGKKDFTPELADYILALDFSDADKVRMRELAVRNQDEPLHPGEKEELANYVKAGHLLALLQSKARIARMQQLS